MNEHWKEWLHNKIYLLSTPVGAGVGIVSFTLGLLLGKLILTTLRGF